MTGILLYTDGTHALTEVFDYKDFQDAVGGFFEIVRPVGLTHQYVMLVNEMGLLDDLDMNPVASWLYGYQIHGNPIVGRVLILADGYRDGEPDLVGLEGADIANLEKLLTELERKI